MGTHVKGFLQQQQQQGNKSVLRNYIDDFIQRAFLQHIKTDYSKRYLFIQCTYSLCSNKNLECKIVSKVLKHLNVLINPWREIPPGHYST